MINAKEAKRKATLNGEMKKEMVKIEKDIERAIERGQFSTSISTRGYEKEVAEYILAELAELGYKATYDPPKPLPLGCRSDQWDFYGYLKVSWED